MCLVKVHEEPDIAVPYRVHREPPRRRSTRVSRTYIEEERRRPPSVVSHHHHSSQHFARVSNPPALQVPPPQPVPVFVQPPPHSVPVPVPPPPPPPPPTAPRVPSPPPSAHYVEVSPRSSYSSSDRGNEYVLREREVRRERREYEHSPARSSYTDYRRSRGPEYETFRYIEPPEERREPRWAGGRDRSRSRDYRADDPRASYRSTRIEVHNSRRGGDRDYYR
ncbi:uncharacterized protein K452DRAFT_26769 [Aplosporella prunicola CBS 121167]|uniref:Uncharacterized protein n=1 Tax=Aplosporella prunicola CBS 121167 TaxID=1176127 RepID=A0A6A6BFM7_9PEZI|nr:uncharacterized protein K452DRAFT_26769 [Aplosporella prunicola CBS 121167]KAF2142115.1 hypothetical protein K452DRAFT_26769 [Aplosporella prunicola CBS 121167]